MLSDRAQMLFSDRYQRAVDQPPFSDQLAHPPQGIVNGRFVIQFQMIGHLPGQMVTSASNYEFDFHSLQSVFEIQAFPEPQHGQFGARAILTVLMFPLYPS